MKEKTTPPVYHLSDSNWLQTTKGEPRGYIQPQSLSELWFHTGTNCNLKCPFCFEGSSPGNYRLESPTLNDLKPFMAEAIKLGTKQFSFTGGEPFLNPEIIDFLDYALDLNSCLVLTNATKPLLNKLSELNKLRTKKHSLTFRVSIDFPNAKAHDQNRGEGNFELSLKLIGELHRLGFKVTVARHFESDEDTEAVNAAFLSIFKKVGLPEQTHIVSFTDLALPNTHPEVPQITENCMTSYKTQEEREQFMCNYSKMVVKKDGRMSVCSCTLVDDDEEYYLADNLKEAIRYRIMLRHHRCYSCFSCGTSCSEK